MNELWWVSVGGNTCEPARVVFTLGGNNAGNHKTIYTIGCADGTLYHENCGIELVEQIERVPLTPTASMEAKKIWERKVARDKKRGIHHGYRRFD